VNYSPACGLILLAAAVGCSKRSGPSGGLLLKMTTDGTFAAPPTTVHVELETAGDAAPFVNQAYPIGPSSFPATFGVQTNGDPTASVTIDVSLWSGIQPLDERRYVVNDVPTSTVEEVDIVFSPLCTQWVVDQGGIAVSRCGPMGTCDPATGKCATDVYGAAAGDGGAEDGADDGPAPDGAPVDATVAADAATDAAAGETGDADSGGLDGGGVGDASCDPDAGLRCDGTWTQSCVAGRWTNQTQCLGGFLCTQGLCETVPPSCVGDAPPGPGYSSDCESREVPGGAFDRDGDGGASDASAPATVHGLRIDTFEVSVARFNEFTTAVGSSLGAALPDAGAGKHTYLNDGNGLVIGQGDGGLVYETGWDPSWAQGIATTAAGWANNLLCSPAQYATSAESFSVSSIDMDYPVNCVTWYEAYAFCIWDGGFLPTETEWSYAASGGAEQRVFPWGSIEPGTSSQYAIYGCYFQAQGVCTNLDTNINFVGQEQTVSGRGLWGQWDLAGNVAEWTLDAYRDPYPTPCVDCTAAPDGGPSQRVFRGGSYDSDESTLFNVSRAAADPATRSTEIGFRCARAP
jgi:sulfatase modifying factor 1